jgi:hypothetical protein
MPTNTYSNFLPDLQQLAADAESNTIGNWIAVRNDLESIVSDIFASLNPDQYTNLMAIIATAHAVQTDETIDWQALLAEALAAGKLLTPYIIAILTLLAQQFDAANRR